MRNVRIVFILAFVLAASLASAQTPPAQAKVADAHGTVEKRTAPRGNLWQPISVGDLMSPNAFLRTGPDSAVLLVFPDQHAIRIGESAQVQLKELGQGGAYSFELIRGQIWSFVNKAKKPAKYEVETPSTVLGVSGTLFSAEYRPALNQSDVSVSDGQVRLGKGDTVTTVDKGFQSTIHTGQVGAPPVQKLDKQNEQMWNHMEKSESWTKGQANPKINPQTEAQIRTLRQQRQQEQRKQEQQQKKQAAKKKAPPPKPLD
jgi:hypothetical protein